MQIRGIFEVLPNICNRDFLHKYYKINFLHGPKNASTPELMWVLFQIIMEISCQHAGLNLK